MGGVSRLRAGLIATCLLIAGCTEDQSDAREEGSFTSVSFGLYPSVVVEQGGFIWALDGRENTIAKIDPQEDEIAGEIDLELRERDTAWDMVSAGGSLWVTVPNRSLIVEVDPQSLDVVDEIEVGSRVSDVYSAAGTLWVDTGPKIDRIDPETGRVVASIPYPGDQPHISDIVEHNGVVWLVRDDGEYIAGGGPNPTYKMSAELWRISPSSNDVQSRLDLGSTYTRGAVNPVIGDVEVVDEGLWMSRVSERRVVLVDPIDGELLLQFVVGIFEHPWEFAVVDGDLWIGELNGDEVAHIDTETRERTVFDLGREDLGVSNIEGGFGSLWVPLGGPVTGEGRVVRLDPPSVN